MARVRAELRDHILGYWRGHSEAWRLSELTQREYCEQHGISLKNFGNWRGQLKRIAIAGPDARWGHYPRLRHMTEHMSKHMPEMRASHMAKTPSTATQPSPAPATVPVPPPGARRQFSEEVKQRIVMETCVPGASVSAVARRYSISLRLLFKWRRDIGAEPLPERIAFVSIEASYSEGGQP